MNHAASEQKEIGEGPSWDRFKQVHGVSRVGLQLPWTEIQDWKSLIIPSYPQKIWSQSSITDNLNVESLLGLDDITNKHALWSI